MSRKSGMTKTGTPSTGTNTTITGTASTTRTGTNMNMKAATTLKTANGSIMWKARTSIIKYKFFECECVGKDVRCLCFSSSTY